MTPCRGVLRTFHHRVGFAVRDLRRHNLCKDPPLLEAAVGMQRPVKDHFSHSTGDLDVRWPFWREDRKRARHKAVTCQIWTEDFADVIEAPMLEAALLVDLDEDGDPDVAVALQGGDGRYDWKLCMGP